MDAEQITVPKPTSRQAEFLALECEEALYGGAVGGAKTIGLFLWLAQGVNLPNYTGYFFRRTWAECHGGNDSPLAKSFSIFQPMGATWVGGEKKTWTFPTGAKIVFGHLEHAQAHLKYQGPSAHRMAFDELTHFTEDQYTWMIAYRIRKLVGYPINCGSRASCNPGGPGHDWVRRRFITPEAIKALGTLDPREPCPVGLVFWPERNRAFVPARLADNPHIDIDDYEARMMTQSSSPVIRARMMNGDWSVRDDTLINEDWLRYFDMRGQILRPRKADGELIGHDAVIDERECRRFAVCDPAGTSQQRTREMKGKPRSWSVIEVWDYWAATSYLFLRYVWRKRVGFDGLCAGLVDTHREWKVQTTYIENENLGTAACDILRNDIQIQTVPTGGRDKVSRAAPLLNKLERGEIFLPKFDNDWRPDLEAEWLGWTGLEDETSDQIDAAAYAAVLGKGLAPVKVDAGFWAGVPAGNGRGGLWRMKRG